jgi:hypothetical protein
MPDYIVLNRQLNRQQKALVVCVADVTLEPIGLSGKRYRAQIQGERLAPVGLQVLVVGAPHRGKAQRDGGAVVDA